MAPPWAYRQAVSVVIVVPGHEPWLVAGWAFRALRAHAEPLLHADDRDVLLQAEALNGLHLDHLSDAQSRRVRAALVKAARQLQPRLQGAPDDLDRQFARALGLLVQMLTAQVSEDG